MQHPSPCVMHQGFINRQGYGHISHRVDGKVVTDRAHRAAWVATHGDIPAGLQIHHVCGERACVNVEHLVLVEPAEHYRLHVEARTHCRVGHPRTEENTYIDRKGRRHCRPCRVEAARRLRARKAVA